MPKTKFKKLSTEEVAKLAPELQVKYFAELAIAFEELETANAETVKENKTLSGAVTELQTSVDELTEALNNSEVKMGSGKPVIKYNKKNYRVTAKWFVHKGVRTSIDVLLDVKNPKRNEIIEELLEKKSGLLVEVDGE